VAINGTTVGYYVFRCCEANRRETTNPWEASEDELEEGLFCGDSGAEATAADETCPGCGRRFDEGA
jgi:hypothetical protein